MGRSADNRAMDVFLESPALRMAGAALATGVSVSALSQVARRWGRGAWATTSALVLGADARGGAAQGDLRFAAIVAGLASATAWVLALEEPLRELPHATRALALGGGFVSAALVVSALADLIANETRPPEPAPLDPQLREALGTAVRAGGIAYGAAATVATNPTVRAAAGAVSGAAVEAGRSVLAAAASALRPKRTREEVRALLDHAAAEVVAAKARAEDASTREALVSMEEALASYALVLEEPEADLDRVERAIREVVALARRCDEDDAADAFRALGVRRDARIEDVRRIYRGLAQIYQSDTGLPGVDAEKMAELTAAYETVSAYWEQSEGR
jgi:hypothetical protein